MSETANTASTHNPASQRTIRQADAATQEQEVAYAPEVAESNIGSLHAAGHPLSKGAVLSLQHTLGNRAVARMVDVRRSQPAQRHVSARAIQRAELSDEQNQQFETVSAAMKAWKDWKSGVALDDVLKELKLLVKDDPMILPKLTDVFVNRKVELIGDPDGGAGYYDYSINTLTIFTQTAREMADTIVFEIGNAGRREAFQKSDDPLKKREDQGFVAKGQQVADIEAETTLDYLDSVLRMIANGKTLAQLPPGAKRQYLYFMDNHPDYFNMDEKRRQEFRATYKKEMRTSPHDQKAADGTRMHLDSQDLYSYEKVCDKMQTSGVITMVKEYVEKQYGKKFKPAEWGGVVNEVPLKPPMKKTSDVVPTEARGKFYMVTVERAEQYYEVDLSHLKFNAAQATVAENEVKSSGWDPQTVYEAPGSEWQHPAKK
jgi:hypothetical protein